MAPDMLLGMDEARGESKTVIGVYDKETGKLTPIHYSDKPVTFEEIESVRDRLVNMSVPISVSWTAKVKCEIFGKKPRLPRKLKKKLRTDWRLYCSILNDYHSSVWPNPKPHFDFVEAKLAASGLSYDIPDWGASMGVLRRAFDPNHYYKD